MKFSWVRNKLQQNSRTWEKIQVMKKNEKARVKGELAYKHFKASRFLDQPSRTRSFVALNSPRSWHENERKWQGFGFLMKLVSVLKSLVQWIKVLAYLNPSILTHEWLLAGHGNCVHQAHNWYVFLLNFY